MKYYHVDAFTQEAFKGNSAGIVICIENDIQDNIKQSLASEFKHSETAFVFIRTNEIILRWFTPLREVDLCGHATIAAAFSLWDSGIIGKKEQIEFLTYTNDRGVMTRPAWKLMNKLPMFKNCTCGDLSNALWLEERLVNIPSGVKL